jgi:hypothetical protein
MFLGRIFTFDSDEKLSALQEGGYRIHEIRENEFL